MSDLATVFHELGENVKAKNLSKLYAKFDTNK